MKNKKVSSGKFLLLIDILFWVVYNTYFGWNKNPLSDNELLCDIIFSKTLSVAIVLYVLPVFDWYEYKANEFTNKSKK